MALTRAELQVAVDANWSKLMAAIRSTDEEFAATYKAVAIWDLLGVGQRDMPSGTNYTRTLVSMRQLFFDYDFLLLDSTNAPMLFMQHGKVACMHCSCDNLQGQVVCKSAFVGRHAATESHKEAAAKAADKPVQKELVQMGFMRGAQAKKMQKDAIAALVGHFVAAGVPYTAIHKLLSKNTLEVSRWF